MHKIGIDLGGTKIETIVLDANNREIFRKRIPTE
jgi:fructokinase